MLTQEIRTKLIEQIQENPQKAIEEIKKDPEILKFLLARDTELNKTKEQLANERIKYVNMNSQMQRQLDEQAKKLKTTQGLLIGAGVLWFLSLLDKK